MWYCLRCNKNRKISNLKKIYTFPCTNYELTNYTVTIIMSMFFKAVCCYVKVNNTQRPTNMCPGPIKSKHPRMIFNQQNKIITMTKMCFL